MEKVDFRFINFTADSMEFRGKMKMHSEWITTFEKKLKEILD
jgi:hypothetical protein